VISDLGAPPPTCTHGLQVEKIEKACRRLSCVFPDICDNLNTDNPADPYVPRPCAAGNQKVLISSGLRYDLAVRSPEYIKELVQHHVGGY